MAVRLAVRAVIVEQGRLLLVNAWPEAAPAAAPEAAPEDAPQAACQGSPEGLPAGPGAGARDRDLWCAPGGGVAAHASLPANLAREVREETGLAIAVGAPCLVNEFHDPAAGFHQVDIFFRCRIIGGALDPGWRDPEAVVSRRRFFTRDELATIRVKPDSLARVAFGAGCLYDPLEPLLPRPAPPAARRRD
ncbi:MAG: NUDIX hydrolase [Roseovarius sp.]